MSKKIVYQTNGKGYYIGEVYSYNGRMPNNAVDIAPPTKKEGFIQYYDKTTNTWSQVEDHLGETGYVNNEPFTITEYGPYPEGWAEEYVKSEAEILQEEISNLQSQILQNDTSLARPMSAVLTDILEGTENSSQEDRDRVLALKKANDELRIQKQEKENQLANLTNE